MEFFNNNKLDDWRNYIQDVGIVLLINDIKAETINLLRFELETAEDSWYIIYRGSFTDFVIDCKEAGFGFTIKLED